MNTENTDIYKNTVANSNSLDIGEIKLLDPKKVIELINEKISETGEQEINPDLQNELSQVIALLQRIEYLIQKEIKIQNTKPLIRNPTQKKPHAVELNFLVLSLETATHSLLQKEPNFELSRKLRREVKRIVCRYEFGMLALFINRYHDVKRSEFVPLKVLYGLIASLSLSGGFVLFTLIPFAYFQVVSDKESPTKDAITILEKNIVKIVTGSQDLSEKFSSKQEKSESRVLSESEVMPGAAVVSKVVDSKIGRADLTRAESQLRYLRKMRDEELGIVYVLFQIALVIFAGTLGSIVSILTRIEDFREEKYANDPVIPILVGAFKPIIGASFALFIYAMLNSGLIWILPIHGNKSEPFQTDSTEILNKTNNLIEGNQFFIFAIAFVVGFSERLAKDAIHRIENSVGGDGDD